MRQSIVLAFVSLVACLAIGPAHAQAPAATSATQGAPTEDAKKEASGHFRRAVELYQEGAFRAALVEFQRAYDIAPDYRLLYNIGQAQLQVQDYLGATRSYERYLTEGGSQVAPERRSEVETALGALSERVARLSIKVNLPNAEVFVDDRSVGRSPLAGTVSVNVGRHRVFARMDDGTEAERIVDAAGGDLLEVPIELVPKAAQPQPVAMVTPTEEKREPLSRKKRAALAMWGTALATGVGAIVTGVMANGKTDDLDKELDIRPPNGEANPNKVRDLRDSADTLALTTDILAATALASGVTGLVLWLVDMRGAHADADVSVGDQAKRDKTARAPVTQVSWGVGLGTFSVKGKF